MVLRFLEMAVSTPHIQFELLVPFRLPARRKLKSFLADLFHSENTEMLSLVYIFCSDDYLHQLNLQFLSHDTLTDIITFPLSEPGDPVEGEIYISIDRIRENATKFHTSFLHELHRVIFHGALHLCGYKDKSRTDKALMTRKEDHYLSLYS